MSDSGGDTFDLYEGLDEFADILPIETRVDEPVEENVKEDDDVNVIIDDEDDGFTFILEGDDVEPKPTKRSSRASIYKKKERVYYVGAPRQQSHSPIGNIEFFVLVNGIPSTMDNLEFQSSINKVTENVKFCKVLYNFFNGSALSIGIVEFDDISSCTTFLNKSKFQCVPMPLDIYNALKACEYYREGVVHEDVVKLICKLFSVPYHSNKLKSGPSADLSDEFLMEIEFEKVQGEMIKNGDFAIAAKLFPWFNISLLSLAGNYRRTFVHSTDPDVHKNPVLASVDNSPARADRMNAQNGQMNDHHDHHNDHSGESLKRKDDKKKRESDLKRRDEDSVKKRDKSAKRKEEPSHKKSKEDSSLKRKRTTDDGSSKRKRRDAQNGGRTDAHMGHSMDHSRDSIEAAKRTKDHHKGTDRDSHKGKERSSKDKRRSSDSTMATHNDDSMDVHRDHHNDHSGKEAKRDKRSSAAKKDVKTRDEKKRSKRDDQMGHQNDHSIETHSGRRGDKIRGTERSLDKSKREKRSVELADATKSRSSHKREEPIKLAKGVAQHSKDFKSPFADVMPTHGTKGGERDGPLDAKNGSAGGTNGGRMDAPTEGRMDVHPTRGRMDSQDDGMSGQSIVTTMDERREEKRSDGKQITIKNSLDEPKKLLHPDLSKDLDSIRESKVRRLKLERKLRKASEKVSKRSKRLLLDKGEYKRRRR